MPDISRLDLVRRANLAFEGSQEKCLICPRQCGANRLGGEKGYCRAPANPVIYGYFPHHGEEPPLSGTRGSGTIFFSHCNMKCVYCQNYHFSQLDAGEDVSVEELADIMLSLEAAACHNINLVGPTHYVPQILAALEKAMDRGLRIPIVYNTSGYDLADTLKLLDGIVDIYLPDMRYSDDEMAKVYSDAPDYTERNRLAVLEMRRQAGDLTLDINSIAKSGLIIRLLVLPDDISGTKASLNFIRHKIGQNTCLSIMSQYYPTYKAYDYDELASGVSSAAYKNVVDAAKELGLNNGWIQEEPALKDPKFFGTNIPPK